MRIYQVNQVQNAYGISQTKPIARPKTKEKDMVTVSEIAKDYQIAYGAARKSDEVRADRVAELKAQIQSGNYNVSAKEVCEKIVSQIDLKG
ncbi:MAG: flagellar biosynthesis anti-sigma factor FlgM [Cellulosilyticaceae bacterium]